MAFAFAGQIFQFIARPCNVDTYGFDFTLRHPLNLKKAQNDAVENLVLKPKCIGPKLYFRAEVSIRLNYSSDRNVPWAKVSLGPK